MQTVQTRIRCQIGVSDKVRYSSACLQNVIPSRLGFESTFVHKLRKTVSKFYRRYYDLISKFQVGLKSCLRQGLSEPDFYGDLVYKLKKIVGSNNFSAQFIKIISHYKKIGYNINVLQQTACLVVKVSKGAKIRNRYNQVLHLTQDTNGKVTNSQQTPQTRAKRSALSQQVTTKHI